MESYVSVSELKAQLNMAEEYEGEDKTLARLLETAQMSVEYHIQRPLSGFEDGDGDLNPMLRHAILVLSAHFYENRSPVAYAQPHPIPYTFEYLLQPFKKYT